MTDLNAVLKAIAANPQRGIFVSRSGAEEQRQLALWIAARLKAKGYIPILQDAHLKHATSCWRWTRRWPRVCACWRCCRASIWRASTA